MNTTHDTHHFDHLTAAAIEAVCHVLGVTTNHTDATHVHGIRRWIAARLGR